MTHSKNKKEQQIVYPMRINKYIALKGFATRREADDLIKKGFILINGTKATLGQKVQNGDKVEITSASKEYLYYAYYKPRGIVTHTAQYGEKEVAKTFKERGLFPIGRLDKESEGLLILTNDGRVTERLLSPDFEHTKEYNVVTQEKIRAGIPGILARGLKTHIYGELAPAESKILGDNVLKIKLTEGKKHQIRVMLDELHLTVKKLKRTKILNIELGNLYPGAMREIVGKELDIFLKEIGLENLK